MLSQVKKQVKKTSFFRNSADNPPSRKGSTIPNKEKKEHKDIQKNQSFNGKATESLFRKSQDNILNSTQKVIIKDFFGGTVNTLQSLMHSFSKNQDHKSLSEQDHRSLSEKEDSYLFTTVMMIKLAMSKELDNKIFKEKLTGYYPNLPAQQHALKELRLLTVNFREKAALEHSLIKGIIDSRLSEMAQDQLIEDTGKYFELLVSDWLKTNYEVEIAAFNQRCTIDCDGNLIIAPYVNDNDSLIAANESNHQNSQEEFPISRSPKMS